MLRGDNKNVRSRKLGRKDIIKIDEEIDLGLDVLGYIDPNITLNIIKNGVLYQKNHLPLPETLTNVIKCGNPRCITMAESNMDQVFRLADRENGIYRCLYCETAHSGKRDI